MLNVLERRFVKHYLANGGNALAAYRAANPDALGSDESIGSAAIRMRDRPAVFDEIQRRLAAEQAQGLMDMEERRRFLSSLVRQDIRTALADNPHLVQKLKVRERVMEDGTVERTTELGLPDKLAALKLDAQLAGDLRERVEVGPLGPLDAALDGLMGLAPGTPVDPLADLL